MKTVVGKTIYILNHYWEGDDNSAPRAWSEDRTELEDYMNKLLKKPECLYDEQTRDLVDDALYEWEQVESDYVTARELESPYYDPTGIPRVTDIPKHIEFMSKVEKECRSKRKEWFKRSRPGLTTMRKLDEYYRFLEAEMSSDRYYITELKHI